VAKVLCTLKNASEQINGIPFVAHELGKISAEISDEVAALFAKIPGFKLVAASAVKEAKAPKASKADAAAEPAAAPAETPAAAS